MICGKEGVEKAMESAFPYEANITNLHGTIMFRGTWHPEGMSVRRILDRKLRAEDVVVGHKVVVAGMKEKFSANPWERCRLLSVLGHSLLKQAVMLRRWTTGDW